MGRNSQSPHFRQAKRDTQQYQELRKRRYDGAVNARPEKFHT